MRLHRFYIGDTKPEGNTMTIDSSDLLHQWRNVFRMREDDRVILFGDLGIEYTCAIRAIDRKAATLSVLEEHHGAKAERPLTLCAALIKRDNFDLIVQKATELGATRIIPVVSERSEKKGLNLERARRILVEATEQCGRTDVPVIAEPMDFSHALDMVARDATIVGFDPTGATFDASAFSKPHLALFVGPEGGWTESELAEMQTYGRVMQLPTFVLRAETAAIATLALARALA